jgi:hypothetical protein
MHKASTYEEQITFAIGRLALDSPKVLHKTLMDKFSIPIEDAEKIRLEAAAKVNKHAAREDAKNKPPDPVPANRLVVRSYADIKPRVAEWAWDRRIPRATLALLVGTEGLGKTAWALALIAKASHGKLPGVFAGQSITTALFTPEDDPERTIGPRLDAAGADRTKVLDFKMRKDQTDVGVSLPEDTAQIAQALIENNVRLIFADPLASLLSPKVNTWSDTDVRAALEPLLSVCAEHDITFLGSLHTNKSNSNDVRQRAIGTVGWRQLARSAFLLGLDPEDDAGKDGSKRILYHDKHNYGPQTLAKRVELVDTEVDIDGVKVGYVRAVEGEECAITDREMLAHEAETPETGRRKTDQARKWLHMELLTGDKSMERLKSLAELTGHAWRTVERAKSELGVKGSRGGDGSIWSLPDDGGLHV